MLKFVPSLDEPKEVPACPNPWGYRSRLPGLKSGHAVIFGVHDVEEAINRIQEGIQVKPELALSFMVPELIQKEADLFKL